MLNDPSAQLIIYEKHRPVATFDIEGTTEIGRRHQHEPPPYMKLTTESGIRVIVADMTETQVSRKHMSIQLLPDDRVLLINESTKNSIPLLGNARLNPSERTTLELPIACEIGSRIIRVAAPPKENLMIHALGSATLAPGQSGSRTIARTPIAHSLLGLGARPNDESYFVQWLQTAMDVFQSATTSDEYLTKAAYAAIDLVGLTSAAVFVRENEQWRLAARESRDAESPGAWQPSQTMLNRALEQKRTFFHSPSTDSDAASLVHVQSIVAAPFLDRHGEVLGVLYGERRSGAKAAIQTPIREIDAKLVELLAFGVASGLARNEQERLRARFEQFFTPELATLLEARGNEMLAARDAQITILFCDIKGFSRISAEKGASIAIEWVGDVLSELSDCVAEYQGVLVDYAGDALEAMWGAPLETNSHASLACMAALSMRRSLKKLNQRWLERLGEVTDISIGIHSGEAKVGNIGSRRKFKYGALGTTVNLASRIQGATKYVGASVLASSNTVSMAKEVSGFRRLGAIRTVNIIEPVEVFELCDEPSEDWASLRSSFESALQLFENGKFTEAHSTLTDVLQHHTTDLPSQRLLERIAVAKNKTGAVESIWTLDGK